MYWPSMQMFKGSDTWKKLPKQMKWSFLGMWKLEDSQMNLEHPEYKIQPNMAYINKRKTGFKAPVKREESED